MAFTILVFIVIIYVAQWANDNDPNTIPDLEDLLGE